MNTIKTMAAAIALAILSTTALADDPPQPAGDSREYLEVELLDEAVEAIQKQTFGFPAMIFLLVPGKPQLIGMEILEPVSEQDINSDYPHNVGGEPITDDIIMFEGSTCIRCKHGGQWKQICW